ncbi:MAG: anti-sigma factor domain-containing protein [Clostridium sp.]
MIKTGIVISIMNGKAGIMTDRGEFVYIKSNKILPKIGEIHTGQLCRKTLSLYRYVITAASLMFIFISSIGAHAYYKPITTIVLSINPSVSLEANRWDKLISSKALNSDGSQILNNIKIKNKSIDDGLELLLKEAKIENFINDKYITDKKVINVNIKSKEGRTIDVSNFKKVIDNNNLNFKISASSNNNDNDKIEIIANNNKINTNDLIPNNKKEIPNKKSNNNSKSIKKPSVDINTNIIKNKPSKSKKESKEKIKKSTEPSINNKQNKTNKDIPLKNYNSNNNKNSSTIKNKSTKNALDEFVEDGED